MVSRRFEIGAAAGFIVLAAAGWWASADLPWESRMMPRLVLVLVALSSAAWLVGVVRAGAREGEHHLPDDSEAKMPIVFALTGAYAVAVVTVGFFIPTLIYITVMSRLLGERRWLVSIGAAVAFAVVAYLLFVVLFERPVPL